MFEMDMLYFIIVATVWSCAMLGFGNLWGSTGKESNKKAE
jgi:hypothetical protein